jgi:hypothetical protein
MENAPAQGARLARGAERNVRQATHNPWVERYARFGYAAKGTVYIIMGGLALVAALGKGGAVTDQTGAVLLLDQQPLGRFLLLVVAVGLAGYALWCWIQAAFDPERYGYDAKGVATRVGYTVVGLTYAGLALTALRVSTGRAGAVKSSDAQAQDWTARLLSLPAGVLLVALAGLVVLAVAGVLFYRAWRADFRAQMSHGLAPAEVRASAIWLGRVGYAALGVVFTIIGLFVLTAAFQRNAGKARGLSGALATLLAQPFGHALLFVVALGLLAYGVYGLAQARFRRIGKA